MPLSLFRLPALLMAWLPLAAWATAPMDLHDRARAQALQDTAYWHLLLRYEPAGDGQWRSEAGSAHFFLSPEGGQSPEAELHALLDGLFAPPAPPDEAVACRFPARKAWIEQALGFSAPPAACPMLAEWKQAIRPAQATLVFAADYLNNPSSMFGHTFLRLDAPEQTEDTRLLAYAVNYAANADARDPITFALKGLSGSYPGVFSLLPYYDKVKEYSDMENRDLWEYQLTFTPEELQRLLDHLWELRSVEFPYYFLTRNCSFQLLALFEAARPGLQMREDFPLQAIPSDTLRRVVAEPGLMRALVYRPAAERRLLQASRDNSRAVNATAKALADAPGTATGLAPEAEAAALEAAYDVLYYRFLAGQQDDRTRGDLRQLLVRRAALPVPAQRVPPPRPAVDPASGHPTARLALAAGEARDAAYLALRLRPAYHDLLDPAPGYREGAHIDFLDTELRVDEARETLRLERLAVVDIDSLAPWDAFFRPWSWFFGFGQRQAGVDDEGRLSLTDSHGVAYADGGGGASFNLTPALYCFGMLAAAAEAGPRLDEGWRMGAGPRAGCLYGGDRMRWRLQVDGRHYNDTDTLELRSTLEGQWRLGPRNGLRLQVGELRAEGQAQGFGEAAWIHYF